MFPFHIGRPTLRVKLFERVVSQDKGFRERLAIKRASKVAELMYLLPQL